MYPCMDYLKIVIYLKYDLQSLELRLGKYLFGVPAALFVLFLFVMYKMTSRYNPG